MLSKNTLDKGLSILVNSPDIINELGLMPNVNFPTMGGKVWWTDLAECNGWRIQQNSITHHCRILDENNIRRAWGSESEITKLFDKILSNKRSRFSEKKSKDSSDEENQIVEKLNKLKKLYENGVLEEDEYRAKRQELVDQL